MSFFGNIVGAATGLLGASWNSRQQARWSNWASSQDFERNANLSWQMWNATNQYNSPAQQMQRFRDAGLNPNLVYGSMPQSPQPAVVKSSTSTPEYKFDLAQSLNLVNQLENSRLNNNLIRAEISNKLQQKDINDVAMSSTLAGIALAKQRLGFDAQQAEDSHQESIARRRLMAANTGGAMLHNLLNQMSYHSKISESQFYDRVFGDGTQGSGDTWQRLGPTWSSILKTLGSFSPAKAVKKRFVYRPYS